MAGFTFARRRSAIICKVTVNSMCGNVTDLQIALGRLKVRKNDSECKTLCAASFEAKSFRNCYKDSPTLLNQFLHFNFYYIMLDSWASQNKRPMSGGCLVKTTQCLGLVMQLHTITCKYDEIQMLFRENIYVAVRICITDVRLGKENTKHL